jgi:hypothetical protein
VAKDVQVYDGATWHSIKGPKGDDGAKGDAGVPGPTAVSLDANNASRLGTDGLIYTPTVVGGSGTVTKVSVVSANGVSGTVDTDATTPAITISLGAITPTSVTLGNATDYHLISAPAAGQLRITSGMGGASRAVFFSDHATNNVSLGLAASTITIGDNNYPTTRGTNGQVLTAYANGKLAWTTPASPPLPASTAPLALAATADTGSLSTYSRADHVHPLPTAAQVGALTQTQGDARYVEMAGDTMTGQLIVRPSAAVDAKGGVSVVGTGSGGMAASSLFTYSDTPISGSTIRLRRWRGAESSPQMVKAGDRLGAIAFQGGGVGYGSLIVSAVTDQMAGDTDGDSSWEFTVQGRNTQSSIFRLTSKTGCYIPLGSAECFFGFNWSTPTHQLEVGGDTMLRGPLEVVGNITSSGTAHAFANGSIPSPAVIGGSASTPTAGTAAAAGSMRWDENFLYIRTGTAWKKVALTAL